MKRLTTDKPTSAVEAMLNYAYAKDGKVFLRYGDGEEDIDLCEYISRESGRNSCRNSPEEVMEGGCLECDCVFAVLHIVATQAAELRERLKFYEDREANGVICPPCKVGDTVYVISNEEVQETTVFSMKAETDANHWVFFIKAKASDGTYKNADGYAPVFGNFMFGVTAFLTREEAEAALEERSKG